MKPHAFSSYNERKLILMTPQINRIVFLLDFLIGGLHQQHEPQFQFTVCLLYLAPDWYIGSQQSKYVMGYDLIISSDNNTVYNDNNNNVGS